MYKAVLVAVSLTFTTAAAVAATTAATNPKATNPPPASAPPVALPTLTAEQIVERNATARGGLAAWRAVQSLTLAGRLDAGGKPNVELPFVMKMKRGHKSRLELAFRDQTALQVYDGAQGWKVRPFLNRNEVEPFTPTEAQAAANLEELDGPLIDHAKKGTRVELVGTERVESDMTYKLRLTSSSGIQRSIWIDGKTFLERRMDGEPKKIDGKLRNVSVYFSEYRTENGLTMPRVLLTVYEGTKVSRKMTVEKVTVNEPMQDALFQKPQLALAN